MSDVHSSRNNMTSFIGIGLYAAAYAASLLELSGQPDFSTVEPLFVLAVMGAMFPALAYFLTRNARMCEPSIAKP